MYKNATKCNETIGKWCKNKHGASKIIDTFETYHVAPRSITSQEECLHQFFDKYLPASKVHALTLDISNFSQKEGEDLPQAWGRYHDMTRNCPAHGFKANELLDIFYNGMTKGTRCYLDSIAGNVSRERTIEEATELLDTIARNYEDWKMEEMNKEELFSEKKQHIHGKL
jgi:hypothetical protein